MKFTLMIVFFLSFFSCYSLNINNAHAVEADDASKIIAPLCTILKYATGLWGKSLLLVGAIFVGVNVFLGKFSVGLLLTFIGASILILNANTLITLLSTGTDLTATVITAGGGCPAAATTTPAISTSGSTTNSNTSGATNNSNTSGSNG